MREKIEPLLKLAWYWKKKLTKHGIKFSLQRQLETGANSWEKRYGILKVTTAAE